MDVKSIIREMLNAGMSEQQIKDNLRELGIEDPDAVVKDALEQMKPVSPEAPAPRAVQAAAKPVSSQAVEQEPGSEKELFGPEPAAARKPSEEDASKPTFSFTRVSDSGESEEAVGERKELAASATDLMRSVSQSSMADLDSVEQKLDQTIALLKALQDINQKILQSQRDVLLRLK